MVPPSHFPLLAEEESLCVGGNVIKLSKSAHTKKAHLEKSRWAFFMLSLCGLLVLTSRAGQ